MKCPKCHYLSFDPEPRCKNCGYDLELSEDLALKTDEGSVEGPLADLTLRDRAAPRRAPITLELVPASPPDPAAVQMAADDPAAPSPIPDEPPPPAAALPPPRSAPARVKAPATASELPLFVKGLAPEVPARRGRDVEPGVSVPAARAPLGVRRSASEPPRVRPRPHAGPSPSGIGPFDRDLLEGLQRAEKEQAARMPPHRAVPASAPHAESSEDAKLDARLTAAAIDGLLLGGIGSVVIFATLRLCGLEPAQISSLPPLPMAAFLLLVTLGYLLMFTIAGGQTLGKMIVGIRVVSAPTAGQGGTLTIRQAAYRELLSVPSVFALGAGYVPAMLGRGPTFHDRLAETRVVRA